MAREGSSGENTTAERVMPKRNPPRDVDAYIKAAPKEARAKLLEVRRIIKATAPEAVEGISYRIPYYNFHGALVWFAAFKNHIGIFLRPPVIAEHKRELKGYETTKSAVHFSMNKPIPAELIRRLIKARIAKNEAYGEKK
jgi:uncharacterized protein YdhG (YjbR/CyaY superfamily)